MLLGQLKHVSDYLCKAGAAASRFTDSLQTLDLIRNLTYQLCTTKGIPTVDRKRTYYRRNTWRCIADAIISCRQFDQSVVTSEQLDEILSVYVDIFRLLLLAGEKVDCSLDQAYRLLIGETSVLAHVHKMLCILCNFSSGFDKGTLARWTEKSPYLSPDRKKKLLQYLDDTFGGPPTLGQLSRKVIVRSVVASGHGLGGHSKLVLENALPKSIVNYVVSLEN